VHLEVHLIMQHVVVFLEVEIQPPLTILFFMHVDIQFPIYVEHYGAILAIMITH